MIGEIEANTQGICSCTRASMMCSLAFPIDRSRMGGGLATHVPDCPHGEVSPGVESRCSEPLVWVENKDIRTVARMPRMRGIRGYRRRVMDLGRVLLPRGCVKSGTSHKYPVSRWRPVRDSNMADMADSQSASRQNREPRLGGALLKDATLILMALAIWGSADHWASSSGLPLALVTAVGTALIAGWFIASLLHEWGHYAGARLSGSRVTLTSPSALLSLRYRFEPEHNNLAQFTAMSLAGSLAHWGVFAAAVLLLPLTSLAQLALVSASFAFAVFASFVEWPIIARTSLRRVAPKDAFGHVNARFLQRNHVIGGFAGLALLLYLALV